MDTQRTVLQVVNAVTVNNSGAARQVLVTPLATMPPTSHVSSVVRPQLSLQAAAIDRFVNKIMIRVESRESNKEFRNFTLRNLDTEVINCCEELKREVRSQLEEDVTTGDFDVGYVQGTNKVIRIRSRLDIQEFWQNFRKGNLILWCDGLSKSTSKRSDDTEPTSKKRKLKPTKDSTKDEEVQKVVEKLMTKHGTNFTTMQLRIWAEMINGGLHSSYDNPPTTSMFSRAGPTSNKSGPSVNQVIVDAAKAFTSSLSGRATSSRCSGPSELIEDRSKLYKQLSELHNLKTANVLSQDEYEAEKETIMELLKKLKDAGTL